MKAFDGDRLDAPVPLRLGAHGPGRVPRGADRAARARGRGGLGAARAGDPPRALPLGARRGPAPLPADAARGAGHRVPRRLRHAARARRTASASRCPPSSWRRPAAGSCTSGRRCRSLRWPPWPGTSPRARWRSASRPPRRAQSSAAALRKLREALPRRVALVAGGDGAPGRRARASTPCTACAISTPGAAGSRRASRWGRPPSPEHDGVIPPARVPRLGFPEARGGDAASEEAR